MILTYQAAEGQEPALTKEDIKFLLEVLDGEWGSFDELDPEWPLSVMYFKLKSVLEKLS